MENTVYIFISPHLDDAALSCGGLINKLIQLGKEVKVVTVFTSDVEEGVPVSWLARRNQSAWNAGMHPFHVRKIEDHNAMNVLGVNFIHLDFLDAMYRSDEYGDWFYKNNTVGVEVNNTDKESVSELLHSKLLEITKGYDGHEILFFCPLSLGGHVDHVIVRNTIEHFNMTNAIIYYEDYPYAERIARNRELFMENMEMKDLTWKAIKVVLSENELNARIASVACYESQLRGLFPSLFERIYEIVKSRLGFINFIHFRHNMDASLKRMDYQLKRYIASVGGERYWIPNSSIFVGIPFLLDN